MEVKRNGYEFCSLNCARCSPEVSTFSIMSESATPALVYQRKKVRRNSVAVSPGQASANPSDGCFCSTSSEAPSVAAKEGKIVSLVDHESEVDGSMDKLPVRSGGDALISKQKCITGCFSGKAGKVPCPGGAPEVENLKSLDMCSVNDNYSSSKSILEHSSASLRTDVDDTGECSSSSALHVEGLKKNLSERDACISILRSQGVLKGASRSRICTSPKDPLASSDSSYTQTCKVCNHSETIRRMLICDQCESAFHVNCCNSRLEKIPFDEWFCHACVTKCNPLETTTREALNVSSDTSEERTCNPLETTTSEALNVSSDTSEERTATSNGELGIMASMLSDTEPHTSLVRVGPEFQAEVPRWSGPSIDEVDTRGEPSVIFPSECVSTYGCCSNKPPRLASIGNWLQCREVINESGDAQETICGKWRRAPLFEVQTEKWECFCSVLWDPAHADCAVPQELDTEQVLKQLKYIEMLRPQLSTKKRKLNPAKSVGSQALLKSARNGRNR